MLKKYFIIILLIGLVVVIILPQLVLAADNAALQKLQDVGNENKNAAYGVADENTITEVVGTAVSAFLALLGVIFLVLMLYAGFNWMTARGDEEKVTKAKDTITRAIIGLIIVVGAYAIWEFIFMRLL